MPNWKKLIVSGSAGSLSSLTVDNNISANSISSSGAITGSDTYIDDWGSVSASLASISSSAVTIPTLQQVTDQGATTNNNIGIGTTSPSYKLEVQGDTFISGNLEIDSGGNNVGVGTDAVDSTTTGIQNTGIGVSALMRNTVGDGNTGMGYQALYHNTITDASVTYTSAQGDNNTAVGRQAMFFNRIGQQNVAIGNIANKDNVSGSFNVAIGNAALENTTNARNNTAVGHKAMQNSADASAVVAIGQNAGKDVTGTNSTYIGSSAIGSTTNSSLTNETVIGYNVTGKGSNTVTIGNSSVTGNYFSGLISGSDVEIDDWGSVSASLASISASSGTTPTLQQVTEQGSSTDQQINITGALTSSGLIYPTVDGVNKEVLVTDGSGNLTFERPNVYANVKNKSGVTLLKGTPVHASSSAGNLSEVIAASASVASTMPATFVLNEDLADEGEGLAVVTGFLNSIDTSAFSEGDVVYVGADGGYTNVKPTGSSNLIQNLGIVIKVDGSNGSGFVYGSGRSNDIPNLPTGKVWVGSDEYSVTSSAVHLDETNGRLGIGTTSPTQELHVEGDIFIRNNSFLKSKDGGATIYDLIGVLSNGHVQVGQPNRGLKFRGGGSTSDIYFELNSATTLTLQGSTRYVGIGTTTPAEKLTVEGNISGSGNLIIEGDITGSDVKIDDWGSVSASLASISSSAVSIPTLQQVTDQGATTDNTIVLDSNSADSPYLSLIDSSDIIFNLYNDGGNVFTITRQENGGPDFRIVADSNNWTGSYIQVGNGSTYGRDATITGSLDVKDGLTVTGSILHDGDLTVTGTVTAQEFHTEFVSASIIYQSGSTKFGDTSDDVHSFSGSLRISGSGDHYFTDGSVGIGTTTPSGSFQVAGPSVLGNDFTTNATYTNKLRTPSIFSDGAGDSLSIASDGYAVQEGPAILIDGRSFTIGSYDNSEVDAGIKFTHTNNTQENDIVQILANATAQITVSGSGNVGIGTTTPAYVLDVAGNANISSSLYITGSVGVGTSSPSTGRLHLVQSSDNVGAGISVEGISGGNTMRLWLDGSTRKINAGGSATMMAFDTSQVYFPTGNVGIGTTSPSYKLDLVGDLRVLSSSINYQENTDVDTGTETIATVNTGSFDGAFFDYLIKSGSNVRAGTVTAVHDGTNVEYNEVSTQDLGSTSVVELSVDISGADMRLRATTTSDDWLIKSLIRTL